MDHLGPPVLGGRGGLPDAVAWRPQALCTRPGPALGHRVLL